MTASFDPVVLMPSYDNVGTLPDIVGRSAALGVPRIVVNDGSTDGTADWLAAASAGATSPPLTVVTHPANRGKAAALRTGFEAAAAAGHTHAVTLDTDGQLDPEDVPALLAVAAARPSCLVIGERDDTRPDYPARSRLGRRLTALAIALECGAHVRDNQCGLRVYPLELVRTVPCRAGRFAWEAEIIPRAVWAGFDVATVPVNCRYFPAGERVSHFRPWRDSLHGIALHARLLLRRLLPIPRRRPRADG